MLALECAIQRRKILRAQPKSKQPVHLAASQRLLRTQQYNSPQALAHFSAFSLCSAGQDQGNLQFELTALALHMTFYLRALRGFLGVEIPLRLAVTDFGESDRTALLTALLLDPIRQEFGTVDCGIDETRQGGRNYYVDLCFHVYATNASGQELELADGGLVNWTQRLLNNAKERCVVSGIGSERVCTEFGSRDSSR